MKNRFRYMVPVAGVLLVLSGGCTSVRGVKPINPEYGQEVSDLNPVLTWEADADSAVTYDLVINEKASGEGFTKKSQYYREGIKGTSHKVEGSDLKPGTLYTWAVRLRKGEETGEWNKQKKTIFLLFYSQSTKRPFEFKTP
jgi:hypothetical protein